MGQAHTKNVIENQVEQIFGAFASATQDCSHSTVSNQEISLEGCSNIVISGVTFDQYVKLDTECMQSATFMNSLDNKLEQRVKQASEAVTSALALSQAEAENVLKNFTKIAVEMKEVFMQSCNSSAYSNQKISCKSTKNANITNINFTQYMEVTKRCVMQSDAVNDIKNSMVIDFSQTASAKVKGLLDGLLQFVFFILIIIGAVLLVFTKGASVVANPLFLGGIIFFVSIALIVAYFLKWWPYKHVYAGDSNDQQGSDRKHNLTILWISIGLLSLDVIVTAAVYLLFYRPKQELARVQKTFLGGQGASAAPSPMSSPLAVPPGGGASAAAILNVLANPALARVPMATLMRAAAPRCDTSERHRLVIPEKRDLEEGFFVDIVTTAMQNPYLKRVLYTSGADDDSSQIVVQTLKSGQEEKVHPLPHADRIILVISGVGEGRLGNRSMLRLTPGSLVVVNRRLIHAIANKNEEPLLLLNIYTRKTFLPGETIYAS